MKKSLLFAIAGLLFAGTINAQITPLGITTTVTVATACTPPCNGTATVTNVTGGTPPYTYLWNVPGNPQQTPTATGLCPGQWQVGVFDAATPFPNQGSTLVTITCATTGINEAVNSNNDILIFPAPAFTELYLQSNFDTKNTMSISIYNVLGSVLQTEIADLRSNDAHQINISRLPTGIYTIEMVGEGDLIRKKFIKQ
jgi:hypothetical protein